jgi:hypothetical protein
MDPAELGGIRWVHVFEEDSAAGSVYRPDSTRIPLSRRPRRQFELHPGGSATLFTGGADDRFDSRVGTWRTDAGGVFVTFPTVPRHGEVKFRITTGSRLKLVTTEDSH